MQDAGATTTEGNDKKLVYSFIRKSYSGITDFNSIILSYGLLLSLTWLN